MHSAFLTPRISLVEPKTPVHANRLVLVGGGVRGAGRAVYRGWCGWVGTREGYYPATHPLTLGLVLPGPNPSPAVRYRVPWALQAACCSLPHTQAPAPSDMPSRTNKGEI